MPSTTRWRRLVSATSKCRPRPSGCGARSGRRTADNARRTGGDVAKRIPLTLACGDYEIVRALKEGAVAPDGVELTILTEMDSSTRHWRFLHNRDFDIAETSASAYIVARGHEVPVTALPVFLHRRFRHG